MKRNSTRTVAVIITLVLFCVIVPYHLLAGSTVRVPDQGMLDLAKEYNRSVGGQTLVVMHQGKVILEDYANGGRKEKWMMLASGTKSFNGIVALAAIEDGIITLEKKVCDSLTEWNQDPLKSQITYQHLLTLTSGLDPGPTDGKSKKLTWNQIIQLPMTGTPGKQFVYGSTHFNTFGEALQRYTKKLFGETYEQYLKRRILNPIGVKVFWGMRCKDGNPQLAGGAYMTAMDWAKFGEWVRNKGVLNHNQLIQADLFSLLTQGSNQNPAYGLTWWLKEPVSKEQIGKIPILRGDMGDIANSDWVPEDLFMAAGAGKQLLYIIPSLELVVVRQAPLGNEKYYRDIEFLSLLLQGNKNPDEKPHGTSFEIDDQMVGNRMISYVGPEIEPYGNRVVYQVPGEENSLWMGFLDPETGLFASEDGKDILIDNNLAFVENSKQGPEWGVTKNGSSIFYCKEDSKGIMQIWRAELTTNPLTIKKLTNSDQKLYCFFTSQSSSSDSIKIACYRGEGSERSHVWFDENTPEKLNTIPYVYTWSQCFRFCPEGRYLFYTSYEKGNRYKKGQAQIGMLDTLTSSYQLLTNDPGSKDDPFPFIAPEFNNELCIATTINHQTVSIYRNVETSSEYWQKVAELNTPKDSKFTYFYSMEPMQLSNSNRDSSYFSLAAYPDDLGDLVPRDESSIWILGLGDQLKRRIDNLMLQGQKNEPETWVNENQIFVYYTYIREEKYYKKVEMHCCKTGILEEKSRVLPFQIEVDNVSRTFYLKIPSSYNTTTSYPLVFVLHGGTGNAISIINDTQWDNVAEEEGFIAVFPEGTPMKDPKTGKEIPDRYIWNDGSVKNTANDVAFFQAMLEYLTQEYTIDEKRIHATGFSNGGSMTFRLGRELDHVFASIAPVSCSDWLDTPEVTSPLSLLYITGTKDPLNPMQGGRMKMGGVEFGPEKPDIREMISEWSVMVDGQINGKTIFENEYVENVVYSNGSSVSKVFCTFVKDLGHYWPGGNPTLSESIGGTKKNLYAINATEVIWKFFSLNPKK